ncbi:hypothetical protein ABRP55_20255 [Pectobacterium zantedeschiae]|uniref:hypothetical protein n=1 Tax=Pectobacterium zantedeschiae TaxID=2034769 RepID=UPI0032ECCC62
MAELRVGGLAMVLPSNGLSSQIHNDWVGTVVRLVRFIPAGQGVSDCIELNDGRPFCHRVDTWLITDGEINGTTQPKYLMPIDGDDFTHEDEREKDLVNG